MTSLTKKNGPECRTSVCDVFHTLGTADYATARLGLALAAPLGASESGHPRAASRTLPQEVPSAR
jgi:hypothetical protein